MYLQEFSILVLINQIWSVLGPPRTFELLSHSMCWVGAALIGCARSTRVFGNRWFLSSASRVCVFNVNRLDCSIPTALSWSIAEPQLNSSARTSWQTGFGVYWSPLFLCPVTFLCMIWLVDGGIAVTWQVYEGAPGRRAAVRDGEGHSIHLRGQVGDI